MCPLVGAEEQAAVGTEVVVHLQHDLEIAERFVGEEDAAVAGDVLAAGDGAVLDDPSATGLVAAGRLWPVWALACQPFSVWPSKIVSKPSSCCSPADASQVRLAAAKETPKIAADIKMVFTVLLP